MSFNKLSERALKGFICDDVDCEVRIFDIVGSTNTEAKRSVLAGLEHDALFAAEKQTAGRGRQGKSFYSPEGSGLYFSAVLHPQIELSDATGITAAAAVAVTEKISALTKTEPKIKWVNDIFIDGKKVCGILTEAVTDFQSGKAKAVIVGIGINLTTSDFPEELQGIAGALNTEIDKNKLAAEIFNRLRELSAKLPDKSFMDEYRKHSLVLGNTVYFTRNGTDYTAKAESISDDGSLTVVTESNEKIVLNSGEISIKLN